MMGSMDNRQVKVHSAYTDQGKYNSLVWLYKVTSDWDHPARLSTLSRSYNAWFNYLVQLIISDSNSIILIFIIYNFIYLILT
jgi:hypothetical protein